MSSTFGDLAEKEGPLTYRVQREHIVDACATAKRIGYEHLSLITAIDWKTHWEVVYHLVQYGKKGVLALKVTLPYDYPDIPSVTALWPTAEWHERETYDLMGINFSNHPNLTRILLPKEYEEFPLRKEVLYGNRS